MLLGVPGLPTRNERFCAFSLLWFQRNGPEKSMLGFCSVVLFDLFTFLSFFLPFSIVLDVFPLLHPFCAFAYSAERSLLPSIIEFVIPNSAQPDAWRRAICYPPGQADAAHRAKDYQFEALHKNLFL